MTPVPTTAPRRGVLALAGVVLVGLAGCTTTDEPEADQPSAPATATESSAPADPSSYLPVPAGVGLTPAGTAVELGESAVLAWAPRQDDVAVVEVSVERIDRTSFEESFQGWQVDKRTAKQTPYFATLEVENLGAGDLGGRVLPLYAATGRDVLIEPTGFQGDFEPCPGSALPEPFTRGERTELCLVFLTDPDDDLRGVAFLPAPDLLPITWSGEITALDSTGRDRTPSETEESGETGGASDAGDAGETPSETS